MVGHLLVQIHRWAFFGLSIWMRDKLFVSLHNIKQLSDFFILLLYVSIIDVAVVACHRISFRCTISI